MQVSTEDMWQSNGANAGAEGTVGAGEQFHSFRAELKRHNGN